MVVCFQCEVDMRQILSRSVVGISEYWLLARRAKPRECDTEAAIQIQMARRASLSGCKCFVQEKGHCSGFCLEGSIA